MAGDSGNNGDAATLIANPPSRSVVKPLVPLAAVLVLSAVFAGCVGDAVDPQTSNTVVQRRAVPVVNLNASLLDAAQFAADQRFGEDRPLTLEDLEGLLPV